MRRATALVGLALALAGCTETSTVATISSAPPISQPLLSASTDPMTPSAARGQPDPFPKGGGVVSLVTPAPTDISMPWRAISLSGATLTLEWATGDSFCVLPRGATLKETAHRVEVGFVSSTRPNQSACPAPFVVATSTLTLAAPLGHRLLVHAPVDAGWTDVFRKLG